GVGREAHVGIPVADADVFAIRVPRRVVREVADDAAVSARARLDRRHRRRVVDFQRDRAGVRHGFDAAGHAVERDAAALRFDLEIAGRARDGGATAYRLRPHFSAEVAQRDTAVGGVDVEVRAAWHIEYDVRPPRLLAVERRALRDDLPGVIRDAHRAE